MAKTGVTFEQVAQAVQALKARGINPTSRAVRDELGGGSPNVIHRHLTALRGNADSTAAPVAVPDALLSAIGAALAHAQAQAVEAQATEVQQAQAEAVELAAVGEALEQRLEELQATLQATQQAQAVERGKVEQLGLELVTARASLDSERIERQQAQQAEAVALARIEALEERASRETARADRLEALLLGGSMAPARPQSAHASVAAQAVGDEPAPARKRPGPKTKAEKAAMAAEALAQQATAPSEAPEAQTAPVEESHLDTLTAPQAEN